MKALDTNILVRLLVGDDPQQLRRALELLQSAEARESAFLVPNLVVLELIWVLERRLRFSRAEILMALTEMKASNVLAFESPEMIEFLCVAGRNARMDLSDLTIGLGARAAGCDTTLTFDRQAAKSELFEAV
jgi:predicted nucleic-acid-binding protein